MNKLRQLYQLNHDYFNADTPELQLKLLHSMAAMTSELDHELMFQIPEECLMPANGNGLCGERKPLSVKVGDRVKATTKEGDVHVGELTAIAVSGVADWAVNICSYGPGRYVTINVTDEMIMKVE